LNNTNNNGSSGSSSVVASFRLNRNDNSGSFSRSLRLLPRCSRRSSSNSSSSVNKPSTSVIVRVFFISRLFQPWAAAL
ncbi:hypothetical protein PIB30_074492, partial [Stylosanthes scabra]|nr:hypothetical protein [Stylosanthes scabra]